MRVIVKIGADEQVYSFPVNEIIIGSSYSCQVPLRYEGVGEQHLRVFLQNGEYLLEDLDSGFPTLVDGKRVEPAQPQVLNSFFPIEVAGIFISIEDDIVEEVVKKDFKPKIEVSSLDETVPEVKIDRSALRRRKKITRRTGKVKKRTRKRRKINTKSNSQKFGLGTILIVSLLLFLSAFIFYRKNMADDKIALEKSAEKLEKVEKEKIEIKDKRVPKSEVELLKSLANESGCKANEKICEIFIDGAPLSSQELIVLKDGTLNFLLSAERLKSYKKMLAYNELDFPRLKIEVEKNYSAYFDWPESETNKYKATFESFKFPQEDYMELILFSAMLTQDKLKGFLKKNEIEYFRLFSFETFAGVRVFNNYIKISGEALNYNIANKDQKVFELKKIFNSYLSKDIKILFESYGLTPFNKFDEKKIVEYARNKSLNFYQSAVSRPSCSDPELSNFCAKLSGIPYIVGAIKSPKSIIVLVDLRLLEKDSSLKFKEDYNEEELKEIINVYRNVNRKRGYTFREFKNKGYIETRLSGVERAQNQLMYAGLKSEVQMELPRYEGVELVTLIAVEDEKLNMFLEFPAQTIKNMKVDEFLSESKYFWKSSLDIFTDFIRKNATSTFPGKE